MYNNGLFNSSLSTSNPFNGLSSSKDLNPTLAEAYARLEALKQQNQVQLRTPQQQTVYSDIASEFKDLTEDELHFIVSSPEYQSINNKYQTEFSEFLTAKFANEYLQTGNQRTLEELLHVIRTKKEKYKEKFATDISEIREQNKLLIDKNNELANNNEKLQEQLRIIQEHLSRG